MSRFQLIITPDGRTMLTTRDRMSADEAVQMVKTFERWREEHKTLVIPDCEVVRVLDLELDPAIEEPA